MKVEKDSWGFLFLFRPHPSGHASVLNATPTFVLIPAFSSCQFSFNPSSSFPSSSSLHALTPLTHSFGNNQYAFDPLVQGGHHQWIETSPSTFPLRLDFSCRFPLCHAPGGHYQSAGVSWREEVYAPVRSPSLPIAFPLTLAGVLRASLIIIRIS